MEELKNYYLEGLSFLLLIFSFIYFLHSLNQHFSQKEELFNIKKQMQLSQNKEIKTQTHEYSLNCFNNILNNAGFENIQIYEKRNHLIATANKNEEAKKKIKKFEYLQLNENDKNITIKWINENQSIQENQNYLLECICFISNDNWIIWINGKQYNQNFRSISQEVKIVKVTEHLVVLQSNGNLTTLEI